MKFKNILLSFYLLIAFQTLVKAQSSWNLNLLYHWEDSTIVADIFYGSKYNEIWGVAQDGREYAIIGTTTGTYVFDVTNPTATQEVGFLSGGNNPGSQYVVHRDYHDYAGYLYMVSDEDRIGLQIYDMQYLPDSMSLVYASDTLFERSHNIFIDSAAGRLYVCSASLTTGAFNALDVYSLANPTNPAFEFSISGFGHAHDVFARNDTVFINAGTSGGLWVMDVSSGGPQVITNLTNYPDRGYNHSGWWSEDGNIYVFADETHGMNLKICDVSDPSNIIVLDTISSGVDSNSIAHNLMIKDNLLYVSYYYDGLQIFDISDPTNVTKVAFFDTYLPANDNSYRGNWGVYCFLPSGNILASDMQSGLFVLGLDPSVLSVEAMETQNSSYEAVVYPNPVETVFNLDLRFNEPTSVRADLYNVDGRWLQTILDQRNISEVKETINLPIHLAAGQYYIRVYSPDFGWKTLKISKTK
jgi:choice-of-anchor B domain-containing protein